MSGGGLSSIRSRISWSVLDQGLSSLTNFVLIVVVANSVDQAGFGAFGLALAAFQFSIAGVRAIVGEPLAVRHADAPPDVFADRAEEAAGTGIATGLAVGLLLLVVAPFAGGATTPLLALAIVLPGLFLQDALRYIAFAAGRPEQAVVLDVLWAVLQVVFVGAALIMSTGPAGYVLAWGGAGVGAGIIGVRVLGHTPRITMTRRWLRDHRDLGPRFAAEAGAVVGVTQAVYVILVATAGLAGAGAYRGALAVFGPLRVVLQGLASVVIPEGVRLRSQPRRLLVLVGSAGAANALVALGVGVVLLLGPSAIGEAMLGETWEGSEPLVLALTFATAASGLAAGAVYGLRALAAARVSLASQLVIGAFTLASCSVGILVDDAAGAAWGLVIAQSFGAVLLWTRLRRSVHEPVPGPDSVG